MRESLSNIYVHPEPFPRNIDFNLLTNMAEKAKWFDNPEK